MPVPRINVRGVYFKFVFVDLAFIRDLAFNQENMVLQLRIFIVTCIWEYDLSSRLTLIKLNNNG